MPTIYQIPHSPFCLAVVRALRAAGVEPTLVEVSNANRADIIRLTNGAYYQVPVLENGGQLIHETGLDSQLVAAYIDEHFAGGRLFPAATRGWQTVVNAYVENDLEAVTFKVCDATYIPSVSDVVERTMLIRHKERKFGVGCVDRWQQERPTLIAEATRLLQPFEQTLTGAGSPFLFGSAPVYTDFLLAGILGNFTYKDAAPFPAELPALHAWYGRLNAFWY